MTHVQGQHTFGDPREGAGGRAPEDGTGTSGAGGQPESVSPLGSDGKTPTGKVHLKVRDIDGNEHVFIVTEDQAKSIVDIAEDHGIELPYSCRSGACFSCCAEVKQGKEWIDLEKTGEKLIDIEENECLCCIGGIKSEAFQQSDDSIIEVEMVN